MRLRCDVEYIVNKTLLGEQVIFGIKSENSFIKVPTRHRDSFISFFESIKGKEIDEIYESLNENEHSYVRILDSAGYFDNEKPVKKSFNEYEKIGTNFFKKDLYNKCKIFMPVKKIKSFLWSYALIAICCSTFILLNLTDVLFKIDIKALSILDIFICLTVMPVTVILLHELGHYIVAQKLGIKAKSLKFGFFIFYPIALVEYEGLPLYPISKRVAVILGGVYMHMLCACIGIVVLKLTGITSNVLNIWIASNVSMILSNLSCASISDGYFLASSIIGINNLRLKGYRFLNNLLKNKTISKKHDERISGIILSFFMASSFIGMYVTNMYWLNLFAICNLYAVMISAALCAFTFINLIIKILKVN